MSDGMGREFTYLSSHATNRYFIPNWGISYRRFVLVCEYEISHYLKIEYDSTQIIILEC